MELKGSKTEKNLMTAFAGESQARNKYTYFASVAKKEGYEQIAAIFLKTADNEKEHAKMWFKALGELGNTAQNLAHAAEGEAAMFAAAAAAAKAGSEATAQMQARFGRAKNLGARSIGPVDAGSASNADIWACFAEG